MATNNQQQPRPERYPEHPVGNSRELPGSCGTPRSRK